MPSPGESSAPGFWAASDRSHVTVVTPAYWVKPLSISGSRGLTRPTPRPVVPVTAQMQSSALRLACHPYGYCPASAQLRWIEQSAARAQTRPRTPCVRPVRVNTVTHMEGAPTVRTRATCRAGVPSARLGTLRCQPRDSAAVLPGVLIPGRGRSQARAPGPALPSARKGLHDQ